MIIEIMKQTTPPANYQFADLNNNQQLLNALEWHWVNNQPLSTPYWAEKLGHETLDKFIYAMSEAGWVISKANARAKWGEFHLNQAMIDKHIDRATQLAYRTKVKVAKYKMRYKENLVDNLTRTPLGVRDTGLKRAGMSKSANQPFKLEVSMLAKYYDAISLNLTKSMDKVMAKWPSVKEDSANYATISRELLDYYIFHPEEEYNMEGNISDSRGRAIYNGLRRIGNPISNKDFRACLIVPRGRIITSTDTQAKADIYRFIAEIAGVKSKSWSAKYLAGKVAYLHKTLHDLDLSTELGRKHLHENIWLERIYAKLDTLETNGSVYWDIPIEIDATMSLAQIVGVLLNDWRLLDKTNVIDGSDLKDAWTIPGVPRDSAKAVGTPRFYGSSASAHKLLTKKKAKFTKDHIRTLNKEFHSGAFGAIIAFKDFLIRHSDVQTPVINMAIWDDKFEVDVNKFRPVGAQVNAYSFWDTKTKRQVVFLNHSVQTVPDYDRFRLYYPTGLIHNLDSQVMDKVLLALNEWAIAIHDAILVLPGTNARNLYISVLEDLRANRHTILASYFISIGATSRGAQIAWANVMAHTEQLCSAVPFEESAMK